MPDALTRAADDLYAAPLGAFIATRKSLAQNLKAAKHDDAAKALLAMPKPTLPAWVVNQLWWNERDAFDALFHAANDLRKHPTARGPYDAAMSALREKARVILTTEEHAPTPAVVRRIASTLQAIAATGSFEPDANGRLTKERESIGFAALGGIAWPTEDEPQTHTRMRTQPPTPSRTQTPSRTRTQTQSRTQTQTQTHTRSQTPSQTQPQTRTHSPTPAQLRTQKRRDAAAAKRAAAIAKRESDRAERAAAAAKRAEDRARAKAKKDRDKLERELRALRREVDDLETKLAARKKRVAAIEEAIAGRA